MDWIIPVVICALIIVAMMFLMSRPRALGGGGQCRVPRREPHGEYNLPETFTEASQSTNQQPQQHHTPPVHHVPPSTHHMPPPTPPMHHG